MTRKQSILVFQQNGSGEKKIEGIRVHGKTRFDLRVISIDERLPEVLDETEGYFPETLAADIVLDFLTHPDLSQDLAAKCRRQGIPVVASGKKLREEGMITPPT